MNEAQADTAARVEDVAAVLHRAIDHSHFNEPVCHRKPAKCFLYGIAEKQAQALADAGLLDAPSRPTPADVATWRREGRCEGCGAYFHHKPGCKATWGVAATDDEPPS